MESNDFDFEDEPSQVKMTPVRKASSAVPKGSARKKKTSLDGVLFNIRRHRMLNQLPDKKSTEK